MHQVVLVVLAETVETHLDLLLEVVALDSVETDKMFQAVHNVKAMVVEALPTVVKAEVATAILLHSTQVTVVLVVAGLATVAVAVAVATQVVLEGNGPQATLVVAVPHTTTAPINQILLTQTQMSVLLQFKGYKEKINAN
jgi:hypothetical protein